MISDQRCSEVEKLGSQQPLIGCLFCFGFIFWVPRGYRVKAAPTGLSETVTSIYMMKYLHLDCRL